MVVRQPRQSKKPSYYLVFLRDTLSTNMFLAHADILKNYYLVRNEFSAEKFNTKLEAVQAYNKFLSRLTIKPPDAWIKVVIKGVVE